MIEFDASSLKVEQRPTAHNFDLFRLSKSKQEVDLCANTIRGYALRGLPIYKQGRAMFASKSELAQFIRNPEAFQKKGKNK